MQVPWRNRKLKTKDFFVLLPLSIHELIKLHFFSVNMNLFHFAYKSHEMVDNKMKHPTLNILDKTTYITHGN